MFYCTSLLATISVCYTLRLVDLIDSLPKNALIQLVAVRTPVVGWRAYLLSKYDCAHVRTCSFHPCVGVASHDKHISEAFGKYERGHRCALNPQAASRTAHVWLYGAN